VYLLGLNEQVLFRLKMLVGIKKSRDVFYSNFLYKHTIFVLEKLKMPKNCQIFQGTKYIYRQSEVGFFLYKIVDGLPWEKIINLLSKHLKSKGGERAKKYFDRVTSKKHQIYKSKEKKRRLVYV